MKNTGTGKVSESLNIHQSDGAKKYISSIITVYNTLNVQKITVNSQLKTRSLYHSLLCFMVKEKKLTCARAPRGARGVNRDWFRLNGD